MTDCSLRTRLVGWILLVEVLVLLAGGFLLYESLLAKSSLPIEEVVPGLLPQTLGLLVVLQVITAGLLWTLLGRHLGSLQQVTELVRQTSGAQLGRRLKLSSQSRELTELEAACNDMFDRLEQSVIRTMQFTAVASHELRTPLTVLRGEIEIARRRRDLDEEMQALFASNLEEISRMSRIIEDLLLLAKSDLGEMPLRIESLELNELLTDLFGQAAVLGEEKDIVVGFYPAEEQIHLQGDGLRLRQLFLNLLSNAIKYTPGGGSVKMTLSQQGSEAVISIRDSGIGIAAEHLPHIFERFYRVDKVKNQGDGGSGLGLSVAQWVVDAHGGKIEARSEVDEGTEFIVTLPLTSS